MNKEHICNAIKQQNVKLNTCRQQIEFKELQQQIKYLNELLLLELKQ